MATMAHRTMKRMSCCPRLKKGRRLTLQKLLPKQHFTQPPPRYTEASLVKELEKRGIGRPSTYASIISTILDRKYASIEQRKLLPSELGLLITDLLVENFPHILDVGFTANLEEQLDKIEEGELDWIQSLQDLLPAVQPGIGTGCQRNAGYQERA